MKIEEAKNLVHELETLILNSVREFEEETGLYVDRVDLSRTHPIGGPYPKLYRVELRVEL
jgi:hypothetical protein